MGYNKQLHKRIGLLARSIKSLSGENRERFVLDNTKGLQNINYVYKGETLLTASVKNSDDESNVAIIKILVGRGADIHRRNAKGYTLVKIAIDFSPLNTKTISYLLDYIDDPSPLYYLEIITTDALVPLLKVYLEKGFDINHFNSSGNTLLMFAIQYSQKHLVDVLLELGADINCVDSNGDSMLMHFLKENSLWFCTNKLGLIQDFLDKGANINYVNPVDGISMLMTLVGSRSNSDKNFVLEILKGNKFEEVNRMSSKGLTALHLALENDSDNFEVVQWLLDQGADVKNITLEFIGTHDIKTVAEKIRLLLEHGCNMRNINVLKEEIILRLIPYADYIDVIKIFLKDDDLDMDYKYSNKISFLSCGLSHNTDLVKLFLNYGADYSLDCHTYEDGDFLYEKSFLGHLDFELEKHKEIYQYIKKMEFERYYMKKIVMADIKVAYNEFVFNPSSIHSQTLAVKWGLNNNIYGKMLEENSVLLRYYGIDSADTLRVKILDALAHI